MQNATYGPRGRQSIRCWWAACLITLFSNDRIICYGSFESSLIFPPPPSCSYLPEPKACAASGANNRASLLMWRRWNIRAWKTARRGDRCAGSGESGACKSGHPRGYTPFRPSSPWSFLKSHLPALWLGAKEVVLQRLKRLRHMIQWDHCGERCSGSGTRHRNCRKSVCGDVCDVYTSARGGREVADAGGSRLAGENHQRTMEKRERGSLLLTLTFAWGIASLTFPSCFLISISAKMKIVADIQSEKKKSVQRKKINHLFDIFSFDSSSLCCNI